MKVLTIVTALAATPAIAQQCAPYDAIADRLEDVYGEHQRVIALGANDTVFSFFANPNTQTWTIVITDADNVGCLVAAGEAFSLVAFPPEGEEG